METLEKVLDRNRLNKTVVTEVKVVLEGTPNEVALSLKNAISSLNAIQMAKEVRLNSDLIGPEATAVLEVVQLVPETNAEVRDRIVSGLTIDEREAMAGLGDKFRLLIGR